MADQGEAKTKTIGFLPIDKVQTLEGWVEYADKELWAKVGDGVKG